MEIPTRVTTARTDYQLTIIDSTLLLERLHNQLSSLISDLRQSWPTFRKDPWKVCSNLLRYSSHTVWQYLSSPSRYLPSVCAALVIVTLVTIAIILDPSRKTSNPNSNEDSLVDEQNVQLISVNDSIEVGIGKNGRGNVGFRAKTGQGSGVEDKSSGGGSGGNKSLIEATQGKLLPPSNIQASVIPGPKSPSLPVAGMDLDPALWSDSKAPQYGDPNSAFQTLSHGPGDGGGIGSNKGLGIGDGLGPGYGPGKDGNMGGDRAQRGCCGEGGSRSNSNGTPTIFKSAEVEQRARLLTKPEPQFTEEARRNQISGTVMLRCVFSSSGDVIQIHAIQTLPFGLTERAIAAARQIKFIPATKAGHPVSVWMQLEYNFNLY